jgi:hypothetical protein
MEEIFNKLIKNNITPNQLYYLYCKKNNIIPSLINAALEAKKLEGEWINPEANSLTSKSALLIKELDSYFTSSKKKSNAGIMGENYSSMIDKYLEIFPKFKLPSGKYARSDKKNLENNFKWFFETHDYTWETILGATQMYLDEYERVGYKYMRTSQYFIRKQNPIEKIFESELANYCEAYMNGSDDYRENYFSEKVV